MTEEDAVRRSSPLATRRASRASRVSAILVTTRQFADRASWEKGRAAAAGVKSDSKAALGAATKLASPDDMLNAVGRELAYDQCVGDYQIRLFEHTAAVANISPDWLSRIYMPWFKEPRPSALAGVKVEKPLSREGGWGKTWEDPPTQP